MLEAADPAFAAFNQRRGAAEKAVSAHDAAIARPLTHQEYKRATLSFYGARDLQRAVTGEELIHYEKGAPLYKEAEQLSRQWVGERAKAKKKYLETHPAPVRHST